MKRFRMFLACLMVATASAGGLAACGDMNSGGSGSSSSSGSGY